MKQKIIFLLCLTLPLFCIAQNSLTIEYNYDAAGNRTGRSKVISIIDPDPELTPPPPDPTPPPPSPPELAVTDPEEGLVSPGFTEPAIPKEYTEYFVEKIARVTVKIYPNPTTEKITLEIANMENLQTGVFKLFSLNGQFLQEQPVHSATTTVSLAGFPTGTYILKVQIKGVVEDWKVIKN